MCMIFNIGSVISFLKIILLCSVFVNQFSNTADNQGQKSSKELVLTASQLEEIRSRLIEAKELKKLKVRPGSHRRATRKYVNKVV
jgi:hypothetical protein